jgi:L-rhamnose-H+ transport protein
MNPGILGLLILLLAGLMNGSFTLPMKFTRNWAWENTWLIWTIFALFIFPPALTLLTVPNLRAVYNQAGLAPILTVASFGAGWGISQVFLGLAVEGIGMALSFSVILGISAAVGSLIPLIRLHPEMVFTRAGLVVFLGVALVLLGVTLAAVAGRRREAGLDAAPAQHGKSRPTIARGLLYASISGLGSALVNFGFAFGGALILAAQQHGAKPLCAPNAAWLPLMVAGGIPNVIYCLYLMRKNSTAPRFSSRGCSSHWILAALMAFFWFASTVLYGVGATLLGPLGAVLGWPFFMSLIVITATGWGVATGEWSHADRRPVRILWLAAGVLVMAIFVLGLSTRLL